MSAQRRDPGGLPARRAPPLAPRLRRHPCPLICSPIKPSAPVSSLHTRGTRGPAISATFNPPPWDAQFQLTAQNDRSRARWAGRGPSPDLTGMVGLDWAPKPVRPGRGGRMAEEGGEQGTAWASGRDGPHSLAPPQVAGPPRPPSPTGPTRGRALLGEVWRSGAGGVPGRRAELQPRTPWAAKSGPLASCSRGQAPDASGLQAEGEPRTPPRRPVPRSRSLAITST